MRRRALLLLLTMLAAPLPSPAQPGEAPEAPGKVNDPTIGEASSNVRDGSRPVHERGRAVRDGNAPRSTNRTVRESSLPAMPSGPVSDRRPSRVERAVASNPARFPRFAPLTDGEFADLAETVRAIEPLPRDAEDSPAADSPAAE